MASPWTRPRRPTPDTRVRRWRWHPGPRAVDPHHALRPAQSRLARPRPLRPLERPRVRSSLLDAAPRPDTTSRSRTCASSASGEAGRRATPRATGGYRGDDRAAGQGFANAVGMAVAERVVARASAPTLIDHHTYVLAATADLDGGRLATKQPRSPATSVSAGSSPSTTTTTSPSTGRPSSPTTTTSRSASWPTAGASTPRRNGERRRRPRGGHS